MRHYRIKSIPSEKINKRLNVSGSLGYANYHIPVQQNIHGDGKRREDIEGRNFILEKLCELGLGEVESGRKKSPFEI